MRKKIIISSLFNLLLLNSFSQIVTKEQTNPDNNSIQTKKVPKEIAKDTATRFYIEASFANTFRSLESNPDFLNEPLGERANESKLGIWSYSLGLTAPVSKHVYFDGALSILRNGEQYSWNSTVNDSSFIYQTKYNYFALPLQLKLQGGKNLKYFIGSGIAPQMYLSYRQDQKWTEAIGKKRNDKITVNNSINSFAFSWISCAGIELSFADYYGLRLSASYRQQLTNTYTKYYGFIQKANAISFNFAITRSF